MNNISKTSTFTPNVGNNLLNNMIINGQFAGNSFYGQSMNSNNPSERIQQIRQQESALRLTNTFPNRANSISNVNQNFQGQFNQMNFRSNKGFNNNQVINNNAQQQYRPMDNDDSYQEKVCIIM